MSLQNLIIQRDTYALDKISKQNLARYIQIFVQAIQKSDTKSILQEDQIQFLTTINNEAKVRGSTRSLVLANTKGDGKVISYEDLVAARVKRTKKSLPKKLRAREEGVGSSRAACLRRRKSPQTQRHAVGSVRGVRKRQRKVPLTRRDVVGSARVLHKIRPSRTIQ